jgi:hypothetical protein
MSPLVGMICRDRRLKHDRGPLESRLRSRRSSRMIRPNDLAVCLSPISFGGRAARFSRRLLMTGDSREVMRNAPIAFRVFLAGVLCRNDYRLKLVEEQRVRIGGSMTAILRALCALGVRASAP